LTFRGFAVGFKRVEALRDALAAEMKEVYPPAVAQLTDLFQRMVECDRECSRIDGLAPDDEHRRLLKVELTARGVKGLLQPDVWIAEQLRLPAFARGNGPVLAWPPPVRPWCAVPDGVAVFDALHRRGTVSEAMLYAFDLLELDGEDLRGLPLSGRKKRLARLLGGRRLGIVLSDHTDEDGATIFRHACVMGLEGIVSKRLTAPYRSGPSRDWIEVKNPDSPAMIRAREAEW
jgi:hypothetical protein